MQSKPANDYPRPVIEPLIAGIPFFKQVQQLDSWQFELLLQHSRVEAYEPGETVLEEGSRSDWLYFLLKGQLLVLAGDDGQAVNYITPGEVFGDLSMLLGQARSATVRADRNCREILVFATGFSVFGELQDTHRISLPVKLLYYRNLVHSLRWKLEVYRSRHREHPLADSHRSVSLYRGAKDTRQELQALHQQACQLGEILIEWNTLFGHLSVVDVSAPGEALLDKLSP